MLKRYKIFALITVLSMVFLTNTNADEKYTANECFEKFSRGTLKFNQALDKAIFKPIAKGYRVLPQPIRTGTNNFVSNLRSLLSFSNNVLQGDFKTAGINTARLAVNTTIGIFGIFDAASQMGFVKNYKKEDYGQTLGSWGVGEGCYLVLPILGPSTVRDLSGSLTNLLGGDPWYNVTVRNDTQYFKDSDYYISRGGDGINFRAKNIESFDNLEKNSIDFYASVKSLYLQDRKKRILNSDDIIDTMDDSDWEELETN